MSLGPHGAAPATAVRRTRDPPHGLASVAGLPRVRRRSALAAALGRRGGGPRHRVGPLVHRRRRHRAVRLGGLRGDARRRAHPADRGLDGDDRGDRHRLRAGRRRAPALSSTQFSPRLVRNFLRDGVTQGVLAVFVGTFASAAAGLYTVGLGAGGRVDRFPRLAVSGAMVLLFVSVAGVIAFADHLAHSLQIDAILFVSTRGTLRAIDAAREGTEEAPPTLPDHAVLIPALRSGYLQVLTPGHLLRYVEEKSVTVALLPRLGDYVVAGTPVAHLWAADAAPRPARRPRSRARRRVRPRPRVRADPAAGCGVRHPAAGRHGVQGAVPGGERPLHRGPGGPPLSDILVTLASRTLGSVVMHHSDRTLVVPARRFADYLASAVGPIRRYGAAEPIVAVALLELMTMCAGTARLSPTRADADRGRPPPCGRTPSAAPRTPPTCGRCTPHTRDWSSLCWRERQVSAARTGCPASRSPRSRC